MALWLSQVAAQAALLFTISGISVQFSSGMLNLVLRHITCVTSDGHLPVMCMSDERLYWCLVFSTDSAQLSVYTIDQRRPSGLKTGRVASPGLKTVGRGS